MMNRRQFCVRSMSTLFMSSLLGAVVRGMVNDAYAATTATPLRNYVVLWMGGGAERVWFDAILSPNGSGDPLGLGPDVFTALDTSGASPVWKYRTTDEKVNGKYHLPFLWNSILPTASGGSFAMKSLAANTAIIRGVHTGLTFDAHGQNVQTVHDPFPSLASIMGSVADSTTDSFIPAIMTTGVFRSATNKNASTITPEANAEEIFKALKFESSANNPYPNAASSKLGAANLDKVVSSFVASITASNQVPARKNQALQILMDDRKKALSLLQKGFAGIREDYEATYLAYANIIAMVMKPSADRILVGLDDKPIQGRGERFQRWTDKQLEYSNFNLIQGFWVAECAQMAHSFAKAEVFLRHKITNCIELEISGMTRIAHEYANLTNGSGVQDFTFDCHYTGDLFRGIAFSRYYQSLAACLGQFRTKLSALPGVNGGNVWGETLVHLRSEFNRGTAHQRGSDHNIRGCVESFFSGAIQDGPIVAGNVEYADDAKVSGNGAPLAEAAGQVIDSKFIFSTVGSLMGYTPSRNHMPILVPSGSKIISNVGAPKNLKKVA